MFAGSHERGPDTPQDLMSRFGQYVHERRLDRLIDLYEPNALFVPEPGNVHSGHAAIQAALAGMLALAPRMDTRIVAVHQVADVALVIVDWKLHGTAPDGSTVAKDGRSADVLRRQADGTWRVLIDHP